MNICTAADWDARVDRSLNVAPQPLRRAVAWLREPSRRWFRLVVGPLLILGSVFSILPVLGLWMLPLGLSLLGEDFPSVKVKLEQVARWVERTWRTLRGS